MNSKKVIFIFIFLAIILLPRNTQTQVINKFGIKGGFILSKMSLSDYNAEIFSNEPSGSYKFLSIDAGIFAELFDSRYFCISTELHFKVNGEEDSRYFTILIPDTNSVIQNYEYKHPNNRFQYISLQMLPRWKYIVNSEDKLYLFGGPRVDFRIGNQYNLIDNAIQFNNFNIEFGFTVGIGNEIWDLLTIEARYEHNITPAYAIQYGDQKIVRKHNSFLILAGLSLKKLLRINL